MLNPNTRSLYTSALTPPPGFIFDEAIGTTFSMDPSVLLSVPVHLALLANDKSTPLRDGIAVLEAVRRLSDRITLYLQRGRALVPGIPNVLYGLLESVAVEVTAPRGGVFHPKLWLIRFLNPETKHVMLRLMVLSRNLTYDRSWDMALTLEGSPGGRNRAKNRELGEFISSLPEMAFYTVPERRQEQANRLAGELRRTNWELPPGFDDIDFHVFGRKRGSWSPAGSKCMVVISPFCTDKALLHVTKNTTEAKALISRPETLLALHPETRAEFTHCLALDEAAETEDGEDLEEVSAKDTHGLHAKVYVFERGWNTHIVLGSANATNAALLNGSNIEILAELIGKRSRVGGVEALLGGDGLGEVLIEPTVPDEPHQIDTELQAAEDVLETARSAIVNAPLGLNCIDGEDGTWNLRMQGLCPRCPGLTSACAWPISVSSDHAVNLWPSDATEFVSFPALAPESLVGLVAFDLAVEDLHLRFVLNLPVDGLPEIRDAAILRTVVRNRDGFLRYLLMLLGDLGDVFGMESEEKSGSQGFWSSKGATSGMPLLEELVKAYSREPERLREIGRVIEQLTMTISGEEVVPKEFLETWQVFQKAMERRDE